MSTVVDLAALDTQGFTVGGDDSNDLAGWSVSSAGDINGDGFADIIIGAPANGDIGAYSGKAYVIFGGPNGFGDIDLGNLQAGQGFTIHSDNFYDLVGLSVSGAGDVNGDGFDDVIVGAISTYGFGYYASTPTAYVIFGKENLSTTIDVSNMAPADGFMMRAEIQSAHYGPGAVSVAAAGDVNGDGFDDIIIGSKYDNYSAGSYGQPAGAAYVVFGKDGVFGTIDLTNLAPETGFEISGEPGSADYAGRSVSGAGDINGDGFDDIIVGVPYGNNGGAYAGEAYVIFGKDTPFGTIVLSNLAPGSGIVIQGDQAEDLAGFSVSGAGDVNGDGVDDIIIGAPYGNSGNPHSGQAYVIFGKKSGLGSIDLTNLAPSDGFIIQGDDTGDHAGWSVSAAGDVNNDGIGDLIVGAPGNDITGAGAPRVIDAGQAYVIFGKLGGSGTIDLTNLASSDGFIIQGSAAYDLAGWSVSSAGDVDGDGFDDLVVGAPYGMLGASQAGAAYIISGRLHFRPDVRDDFDGDGRSDILWRHDSGLVTDWLGTVSGGFTSNFANAAANVPASWQVAATGDFDGDGNDDILWRHDSGLISDWLGEEDGGFADNFANAAANVATSWHVAGVGDFDRDGKDDILWRHDSGLITTWLGEEDGGFADNFANAAANVPTSWHVAATGDFDGDGNDDILWRHDSGLITTWLGEDDGGFADNFANAAANVATSWHVVGTGDFNSDDRDDILWQHDSGLITNWLGEDDGGFAPNGSVLIQGAAGWSVAATGDYNGDTYDDILWRSESGHLTNWLGKENGGFTSNHANFFANVETSWSVQPENLV